MFVCARARGKNTCLMCPWVGCLHSTQTHESYTELTQRVCVCGSNECAFYVLYTRARQLQATTGTRTSCA